MVDKKTVPKFKKIIENKIDEDTLDRINKNAGKFESYVKLVSGSKYRGQKILTGQDTVIFTSVLKHFEDLKNNNLFETNYDPKKLFSKYATNGNKITKEHEELIKDYQKYINKYLKESGKYIELTTSNQEKIFTKKVLENLNWKKGKEIKKSLINNKKNEKYEVEISASGVGSIVFYSKVNGEYVKTKTVLFDMNEGRFSTELYQILVDGKMGVETFRAILYQIKEIQKEEIPPQEIKLAGSVNPYYANISSYKNPVDKVLEDKLAPAYSVMAKIDYEKEIEIRRGGKQNITSAEFLLQNYFYDNNNKVNDKIESEIVNPFVNKYKKNTGNVKGFFALNEVYLNGKKFKVDLEEIEKDFEDMIKRVNTNIPDKFRKYHVDLIQTAKDYLYERVREISQEAENGEEFIKKLNNDKAYSVYLGLLLNYSNLPGQFNIFENPETPYKEVMNMLESDADKKRFSGFRMYNKNMDMVDLYDMKNSVFDKNKELYSKVTSLIVDEFTNLKNPNLLGTITYESKKKEFVQKEVERKTEPIKQIVISKSPSQEEVDVFVKKLKKDPILTKIYQEYYNKINEENGLNKRLKVDGDFGKRSEATNLELPFDQFWTIFNNQSSFEKQILPKYKKKIESDPNEMRKYNAYVQKTSKEFGSGSIGDKWNYLVSYIERTEDKVKKKIIKQDELKELKTLPSRK